VGERGGREPGRLVGELRGASRIYGTGELKVTALQPTYLQLPAGELTLIEGPSGSGKTTILSLLGCVTTPSAGAVLVEGREVAGLPPRELAELRLHHVGFVFQEFNLVAPLSAEENVGLPLLLAGVQGRERKRRVRAALERMGLADRAGSLPRALSGGQKQRVAIARALIAEPTLILCDEPTAALDHAAAEVVMELLREVAGEGRAVVVVTHDLRLTAYAHRVISVMDGRITGERVGAAAVEKSPGASV